MAEIDVDVQELLWDDWNTAHIWERHQLTKEVVEEACYGDAENLKAEESYGGRYLVIAPKPDGQLLAVVLSPKGAGKYYVVSARIASKKERHEYQAWKAGTQL